MWQLLVFVAFFFLWKFIKRYRKPQIIRDLEKQAKIRKDTTLYNIKTILTPGWVEGGDYDPTNCSSLERFSTVMENTRCPFARKSVIWGSADWQEGLTLNENIKRSIPNLLRFAQDTRQRELDGFVFEIQGKAYASDVLVFGDTVRQVLTAISDFDPTEPFDLMSPSSISRRGWRFSFNGEYLFLTAFAVCYPSSNSRYCYGACDDFDSCYVLLQPESSFGRHNIGPDHPWDDTKKTVRQKIRQGFKDFGQPYHVPQARFFPTARLVVPSLDGQDYIEWWKPVPHSNVVKWESHAGPRTMQQDHM